ncbi:hypothetical protein [Streptomyces sp900129855]|uniref:Lipoprotein n=1 Tax=Streptomyces sp. 900129855 TaxID=3155129 RepID=A0ABV2ZGS2_9ACTN
MLTRSSAMVCAVGVLVLVGCSTKGGESSAAPTDTGHSTVSGASAPPPSASPSSPPSLSLSPSPSPSASSSAPASTSPSPVPVTGPDQKLVTMTVSGGFAGVNREVVLRGDGTVRTNDGGESAVRRTTTAQFTSLRTLLGDPELADVPSFTRNTGAADRFQYTLRFGGRTVMTDRSAEEPALDRLIDALEKWLPAN